MNQKRQVVVLATEGKSFLCLKYGVLINANDGGCTLGFDPPMWLTQHLYIISDEEIKEGDCFLGFKAGEIPEDGYWMIVTPENKKEYVGSGTFVKVVKIIATTNPECVIVPEMDKDGFKNKWNNNKDIIKLPRIPEDFIEAFIKSYNEGNVIKEVMVEYNCHWCDPEESKQQCLGLITQSIHECRKTLKLQNDNTIIINKVEEKKYSRREVLSILEDYKDALFCNEVDYTSKWLEEKYPE